MSAMAERAPGGTGAQVAADLSPKEYWNARARRFAGKGPALAAVCSYGMPSFYNWYIHFLQRRALSPWLTPLQGTVLEIGCGVGRWTRRLARSGSDVVGLDLSAVMVAEARLRARREGVADRCQFLVADTANFWLDSQFDRILGITVLQHVLDPKRFQASLERLAAHLIHDGLIVLLEAAPSRPDASCDSEVFVAREERTYLDAFAAAGLRCLAVEGVDSGLFRTLFLPYYRRLPRPLAVAGLFAATCAALPIDLLPVPWGWATAWHKVFVLTHVDDDGALDRRGSRGQATCGAITRRGHRS
jgi:2-polyprenyl-3-methyl-5-hydroxy-6-metoxy-1,4-benzoquinol methylase